jgi:hypothetical protein
MLRKFSLICAVATALFFPVAAFAGHGHGGHWHGHGGHWRGHAYRHWHGGHRYYGGWHHGRRYYGRWYRGPRYYGWYGPGWGGGYGGCVRAGGVVVCW